MSYTLEMPKSHKKDDEDFVTYAGIVNNESKKSKLNKLSPAIFKFHPKPSHGGNYWVLKEYKENIIKKRE